MSALSQLTEILFGLVSVYFLLLILIAYRSWRSDKAELEWISASVDSKLIGEHIAKTTNSSKG